MAKTSLHRKILITISITVALYLVWFFWAGWESILQALAKFNWIILPICFLLSFVNYVIRFTKWQYYLDLLGIPLKKNVSFQVFLAGMTMSATPGKLGEVFKAYLVKEINGTPLSQTAPIVLAERITDFISFLILSLLGITLLPDGLTVFLVCLAVVILILALIGWKRGAEWILGQLSHVPVLNNHSGKFITAYENTYALIRPWPLIWATGISVVSWFMESLAFYLIIRGFGYNLPITQVTFIYAFATILGAVLMTPGGIGPTEGTMGGLLMLLGKVPDEVAASATVLIRLCTLLFGITLGLMVLTFCSKNLCAAPIAEELESMEKEVGNL